MTEDPKPNPWIVHGLALLVVVLAALWFIWPQVGFLDSASYSVAQNEWMAAGWFGAWPGPVHVALLPVGHAALLVSDGLGLGLSGAALAWCFGGVAAALSVWAGCRYARRGGAAMLVVSLAAAVVALGSVPHLLVLPAALLGAWFSIRRRFGVVLWQVALVAVVLSQVLWVQARGTVDFWSNRAGLEGVDLKTADLRPTSSLAAVFLAEELAKGSDQTDYLPARRALQAGVSELKPTLLRLRAEHQLVKLLLRERERGLAAAAAEQACKTADALPDRPGKTGRQVAAYLQAAQCRTLLGRGEGAATWVEKVERLDGEHPDVLAYRAERLLVLLINLQTETLKKGVQKDDPQIVEARRLLEASRQRDAKNFRANVALGRLEWASGNLTKAAMCFDNAIEREPELPEPRLLKAKLYVAHNMYERAEEEIRLGLRRTYDPRLQFTLGKILYLRGDEDGAQRFFESYLKLYPQDTNVRKMLAQVIGARAMQKLGEVKPRELKAAIDRVRELDPGNAHGYVLLAALRSEEKNYKEAIALLGLARGRMGEDQDVLRRLAQALRLHGYQLLLSGKRSAAMDRFREFLGLVPKVRHGLAPQAVRTAVEAHCQRLERDGRSKLGKGEAKAAEVVFRRSAELLDDRAEAHHYVALACMHQKKLTEALGHAERAEACARRQRLDYGMFRMVQIDILMNTGRQDEAKKRAAEILKTPGATAPEILARIKQMTRS